jgi:anti-sigma factor RsiW
MTHLTMDQLVALRTTGSEPGTADAQAHLQACPECARELDRLHQRVARLRALPALRPPRDRFAAVAEQVRHDRRQLRVRRAGIGALALAASLLLAVVGHDLMSPTPAAASDQLTAVMAESATLEQALRQLRSEERVTDTYTTRAVATLEDRIADLDRQLGQAQLNGKAPDDAALLTLWRERVGLMDALVDVHVTRAQNVGL